MDLFEQAYERRLEREGPLAARMRPRNLDEFVGQEHIVGPGRLLRRAIQADQLGSIIFYGPPGTGKTTLARVIANTTRGHFISINAVLAGVKELREAVASAQERAKLYDQRTILFVDEVHRFNKAQQDALLPWVENGTVIFIGATTENPYFEVNKALVSRSRIFQLIPLEASHLRKIIRMALEDPHRGFGDKAVEIDEAAAEHLVDVASGDARAVLNALELAVETTPAVDGKVVVTLEVAEESIQHRAVLYDKEGDVHFDTISAFIKSVRGSDPDAALYWMAKMIYAGEAPRFIFRRMLILASEDVGMADPRALEVVVSCAHAFEQVGLPEGRFHLAQAALYLSTCKKSNSAFAFFDALSTVGKETDSGTPNHLRDPSRDAEGFGHGEGYLYPHAYRDHWVEQQYLPDSLQGKVFYQPSDQGYEAGIRVEVARRREAQLAAMVGSGESGAPLEMLTFSVRDKQLEAWLQRTISGAGQQLGVLRDRVLDGASIQRHALILDLRAGSGLLTWESLRRAPEGGVYALARSARDAEVLRSQAKRLIELERPIVIEGSPWEGLDQISEKDSALCFDAIVAQNGIIDLPDKEALIRRLVELLAPGGRISVAESVPRLTQRLYELLDLTSLGPDLSRRVIEAEEAIYDSGDDPMVNWTPELLISFFESAGLGIWWDLVDISRDLVVSKRLIDRWFEASDRDRPTYSQRLAAVLEPREIGQLKALFERQLLDQTTSWKTKVLYLVGRSSS